MCACNNNKVKEVNEYPENNEAVCVEQQHSSRCTRLQLLLLLLILVSLLLNRPIFPEITPRWAEGLPKKNVSRDCLCEISLSSLNQQCQNTCETCSENEYPENNEAARSRLTDRVAVLPGEILLFPVPARDLATVKAGRASAGETAAVETSPS